MSVHSKALWVSLPNLDSPDSESGEWSGSTQHSTRGSFHQRPKSTDPLTSSQPGSEKARHASAPNKQMTFRCHMCARCTGSCMRNGLEKKVNIQNKNSHFQKMNRELELTFPHGKAVSISECESWIVFVWGKPTGILRNKSLPISSALTLYRCTQVRRSSHASCRLDNQAQLSLVSDQCPWLFLRTRQHPQGWFES